LPEAGEQSGSLITAKFAFEMHKPIYGVPNWIFSSASEGLNNLIGEWKIQMITDFEQMMKKHFKIVNFDDGWKAAEMKWLNEIEIKILNIISEKNWSDLNDLTSDSGLWLNDIMLYLTTLEMQWLVYQESPGIYQRG
jgi:DNA processing protein